MPNKEQIIAEINKIPMLGRSSQNIYATIEPYLLKYDREKMRKIIIDSVFYSTLEVELLEDIEAHLGLHTPAPVGGECICESFATVKGFHKNDCLNFKPQEKKCTCDPQLLANLGHGPRCPLDQQPSLKEAPKVPILYEPTGGPVSERDRILILEGFVQRITAYLRAQQN